MKEGEAMDLRGGRITIGELLSRPDVRARVQRAFPGVLNSPLTARVSGITLNGALQMAARYVPRARLDQLVRELESM